MAGAQCPANGKLVRSSDRARQQKIGHVRASDQQDESDGAKQQQQERLHLPEQACAHRDHRGPDALVDIRIGRRKVLRYAFHVRSCLLDRDAWLQPANSVKAQTRGAIHQQRIVPLPKGDVEFPRTERPQQIKGRGNHSDDGVVPAVECQALSQHIRPRRKFSIPEAGSDHDRGGRSHAVLARREVATDDRNNCQLSEKLGTHKERIQLLRFSETRKDE